MHKIGKTCNLTVIRKFKGGCYLDFNGTEVYMAKIDTSTSLKPGDSVKVIVYNDARNSLKATTQKPVAQLGEFGVMTIKDLQEFGLFLDWGLDKDLFVPAREIQKDYKTGDRIIVYVMSDLKQTSIIGTPRIKEHLSKAGAECTINQRVDLLVYGFTDIGYRVIVNSRYAGMLYKNQVFQKIQYADKLTGYISKIRDDGLLDINLQQTGFKASVSQAEQIILEALENNTGFLKLTDSSSPEEIRRKLNLSKKLFKKTVGILYKMGKIQIKDNGISLK